MASSAEVVGLFCLVVFAAMSSSPSYHARADQDCYEEKDGVMHSCWRYIDGGSGHPVNPAIGGSCCKIVKDADVKCICDKFAPEEKARISLIKWVAVTIRCGNALPRGTDCAG